jgi:hypothetical protein
VELDRSLASIPEENFEIHRELLTQARQLYNEMTTLEVDNEARLRQLFGELARFEAIGGHELFPRMESQDPHYTDISTQYVQTRAIERGLDVILKDGEPDSEDVAIATCEDMFAIECDCGVDPRSPGCCIYQYEHIRDFYLMRRPDLCGSFIDKIWQMAASSHLLQRFETLDGQLDVEKQLFHYKVKRSCAWRLLCRFDDRYWADNFEESDISHEDFVGFLKDVYFIREIMGDTTDHGLRPMILQLEGQGLSLSRMVMAFDRDRVVEAAVTVVKTSLSSLVQSVLEALWNKIKGFFSFLSTQFFEMIEQAFVKLKSFIGEEIFAKFAFLSIDLENPKVRALIISCVLFCAWVALKLMNILSDAVAQQLFHAICFGTGFLFTHSLVPQNEPDLFSMLSTLCLTVIGIKAGQFEKVRSFTKDIMSLMAGGTVIASSLKMLMFLLPVSLRIAFIYKFGTKEQRLEHEIELWKSKAMSLCAVGKIQGVLGSDSYSNKVEQSVSEGTELIRQCTNGVKSCIKQSLMTTYVRLINIHTNLVTRKFSSGDRAIPFAFHVAGPPGIGKTTSVKELLCRACSIRREQMYSKDVADEYWSGYLDHAAILMDEFLLGLPDDNYASAQSYLTMVSCGEWRPNFASVDDPNVGIKGNVCRPKIVVTLNNHTHDRIDKKIDEAFQRRRRFVVQAKRSPLFVEEPNNPQNVDFSAYTEEERAERVWMRFDILVPVCETANPKKIKRDLTFSQLVEFIKTQYDQHQEIVKQVDMMNGSSMSDKTADDIINEVLQGTFGIPQKPMGILEALTTTFKSFVGQGPFSSEEITSVVESEVRTYGEVVTQMYPVEEEDTPLPETTMLDDIWKYCSNNVLRTSLLASSVMVIVLSGVKNYISGGNMESETFIGQSDKSQKHSKGRARRGNFRRGNQMKAQGPSFEVAEISYKGRIFNCVPVCGQWFLTYAHAIADLEIDNSECVLVSKRERYVTTLKPDNVLIDDENDIALLCLEDNRLPRYKNIIRHFIKTDDIEKIGNSDIYIKSEHKEYYANVLLLRNQRYVTNGGSREVILDVAAKYFAPTEHGDCGLPVKLATGPYANKLLGIHVAGTGTSCLRPAGVASFVTQEMLQNALGLIEAQGPNEVATFLPSDFSNLLSFEEVSYNERVNLPTNTKLRPSAIAEEVPFERKKEPAILSSLDPRSNGIHPVENSLKALFSTESPKLDEDLLERIEEELFEKYRDGLQFKAGKRELTFEEACKGIPAILNSITCQTSPGYPLCNIATKKGKTSFVWFEDGELRYTELFKTKVLARVEEMKNYSGEPIGNRFLGFLKDELLKKSKIEAVRTRMTFANDVVSLVAFRVIFGALFVAFMNSFECTGFAVGFNQYSADMDKFYNYLHEVGDRMIAGDYKEFDMRYVKQVEMVAYRLFSRLAQTILGVPKAACDYLINHETMGSFQILNALVKVESSNKSGCWLTTIINCIVNTIYMRYCFYRKMPWLQFDVMIRAIFLGDDHVLSLSKFIDMTPIELAEYMKELGQIYTSAFKDQELKNSYDKFEDITFLGSIPRRSLTGQWTGALRKETLEETPLWTRDNNGSLDQVVQQMVDCASQWDREYFDQYIGHLKNAYERIGRDFGVINSQYTQLHYSVLNRTAASGLNYNTFFGQGPKQSKLMDSKTLPEPVSDEGLSRKECRVVRAGHEYYVRIPEKPGDHWFYSPLQKKTCALYIPGRDLFEGQGPVVEPSQGYVQLVTSEEREATKEEGNLNNSVADLSISCEKVSVPYGTGSWMKRLTFDWTNSSSTGALLYAYFCPFEILNLNNKSSAQDIGFMNFVYSQPEMELAFQINGTPVQQGALCAFFLPFYQTAQALPDIKSWTNLPHVILTPNNNTTRVLKIPFRYYRSWITNPAGYGSVASESIGKLVIGVLSALSTVTLPTTASVTMYSRFVTKFAVPRPRTITGQGPFLDFNFVETKSETRANSISGAVPAQGGGGVVISNTNDVSVPTLPLDNPPISGGSAPYHGKFASLAKSVGLNPTNSLQLHPEMLCRQPHSLTFNEATLVSDILARRSLLTSFYILASDVVGTEELNLPLNSCLTTINAAALGNNDLVAGTLAVLNQFQRWRADIVFDLFVVKTVFHTLRLQAVCGYGYSGSLSTLDWNAFPSELLEFTGETQWRSVRIPFNAPTEYLRTVDGTGGVGRDYSMGSFSLFIANPLKLSSSIVSTSVELKVFVRFENVEVYEPRATPFVGLTPDQLPYLQGQGPMDASQDLPVTSSAAGEQINTTVIDVPRAEGDNYWPEQTAITDIRTIRPIQPCTLERGRKYEYLCRDVLELGRRHYQIVPQSMPGYSFVTYKKPVTSLDTYATTELQASISFYSHPVHPICTTFQMWSGTINYRIILSPTDNTTASLEGISSVSYIPSTQVTNTEALTSTVATPFPAPTVANTTQFDVFGAIPGPMTIGQTAAGTTSLWASNTYLYKSPLAVNSVAQELLFPIGGGTWMADIAVPFNTHYHYCPTFKNVTTSYEDMYNGRLVITLPKNYTKYNLVVYQQFGDDFKLHAYMPSFTAIGYGFNQTATTYTKPTTGSQIGQLTF